MSTTPILPHLDFRCRVVGGVSSEPPPRRGVGDARSPRCRYAQAAFSKRRPLTVAVVSSHSGSTNGVVSPNSLPSFKWSALRYRQPGVIIFSSSYTPLSPAQVS